MRLHKPATNPATQPQVLIADDDAVTRRILQHWVEAWGYQVVIANDGNEAWKILQQENAPKLIMIDWMMPGMDGIELCRRLRSESRDYYQYILMITGRSEMQHVVHALESGADDCIAKPFEEMELKARLIVASRILALQDELIHAREELRRQAMKDSLTDLWNRAAFSELLDHEIDRGRRAQSNTGLLLIDLDHFKVINDTHGHLVGDLVLKKTARLLCGLVRSYDFVGRFGGEEFLIAFPNCDIQHLCRQAERIRAAISSGPLHVATTEIPITISIGAAITSANQRTMADILAVADVALYHAKNAGRNCSVFCRKPLSPSHESHGNPRASCSTCDPALSAQCILSTKGMPR